MKNKLLLHKIVLWVHRLYTRGSIVHGACVELVKVVIGGKHALLFVDKSCYCCTGKSSVCGMRISRVRLGD
jgi:hypothetical protein